MEARTHTPAKGWTRLETDLGDIVKPSSNRWLEDARNSMTRKLYPVQSAGRSGLISFNVHSWVETGWSKVTDFISAPFARGAAKHAAKRIGIAVAVRHRRAMTSPIGLVDEFMSSE